jgi:membrane-associated phospholipid phosphatase
MPTSLLILTTGLVIGLIASGLSISNRAPIEPLDVLTEKRWVVQNLSRSPRLAAFIDRRLSTEAAGGLLLTFGFASVLLLATFVGALFDMIDQGVGFAAFDSSVAEYGATHAGSAAEEVLEFMTRLGGAPVIGLVLTATSIWGWWRYRNIHVALFMVTVIVGQAVINTGLKWLVDRDRPDIAQLAPFTGSSFPSGHSAAAAATYFAAAMVLTLRSGPRLKAFAAGVAALLAGGVGATRALLGVHWLTDVLAGIAVGFGWFLVCAVVFGGRIMRFGEPETEIRSPLQSE